MIDIKEQNQKNSHYTLNSLLSGRQRQQYTPKRRYSYTRHDVTSHRPNADIAVRHSVNKTEESWCRYKILIIKMFVNTSRGISVGMAANLRNGRLRNGRYIPGRAKSYLPSA